MTVDEVWSGRPGVHNGHHTDASASDGAPEQDVSAGRPLVLSRPLGGSTWLATADGDQVAARLAAATFDETAPTFPGAVHSLGRLLGTDGAHLVPLRGTGRVDGATWLICDYETGVGLDRLLTAAILTPVQATHIAAEIFTGLAELHDAGIGHGRLTARKVVVGDDGGVRLSDWAVTALGPAYDVEAVREADLDAARTIVGQLARNADRPAVRHHDAYARLLTGMERIGTVRQGDAAADIARQLRDLLHVTIRTGSGSGIVRTELAALVRASMRLPARARVKYAREQHLPASDERVPRSPRGRLPSTPLSAADWRGPRRRRWLWVAVAVVAVLLGAGYVVARKPVTSFADRLLHRHPAGASAPATTGSQAGAKRTHNGPRAVPVLAPSHAGAVTAVSIRPVAACRPGSLCAARLTIKVRPGHSTRRVTWALTVVNRCAGTRATRHGGTMSIGPGSSSMYTTQKIRIPAGRAFAVVAVTTTPVHVASAPLLVPPRAATC
jgi:hypothetical protein